MGYPIKCKDCGRETWAPNIVDLIKDYTEKNGKIKCICGSTNASIYQESNLQEKGQTWKRWIKGNIPIKTDVETYRPYVFLTAQTEDGEVDGIHFNYYKDTRNEEGGRLKHGHGPGGAPVFSKDEFFQLLEKLVDYGCISRKELFNFINKENNVIS